MARKPQKPQKGQPAIRELYNTVCDIIDYLPSLEVTGDQKSTYVTKSAAGTVIHATQNDNFSVKSNKYYAGNGLRLVSGNVFESALSGGTDIQIVNNVINYTGSGGGGGGGDGHTYTGELNKYNSGFIWVDQSGSDPRLISSTLRYLTQLYNYPLTTSYHFLQTPDIKEGAGTTVNYHYDSIGNTVIDPQTGEEHLVKWIDGIEVDLNVSGGTYITTNFYHGVGYGDYSSASINCNLFGTYDWYPHTTGFIGIVPLEDYNGNVTGGIISTNLHGDETTIHIDPKYGTISCMLDPGGTTIVASGVPYPNYQELRHDDYGSVSGIGISWLLPVKKDSNVCFYTAAGNSCAYGTFATHEIDENDHYQRATIYNGQPYVPSTDGWVRLSVFDDGTHAGECLRFTDSYSDSNSWNYATPLYRFHGFKALSGDGTTIDVVGNTISGRYTGDGSKIQVQGNTISWIGGATGGGFGVPDYAKLGISNDPGESVIGLGTTFLVPIGKGSTLKYSSAGGTVIARWAPLSGSSTPAFAITTTNSSATDEDGYARVTVIDPGDLTAGCLRLYVNNNSFPLYKFSVKPSVAGSGLVATKLKNANNVVTGLSFDLSAKFYNDLTTISGRGANVILSSDSSSGLVWAQNPNAPYQGDNTYISVNNTTHTISWIGGPTGGGSFAPDYSYLSASEDAGMTTNGLGVTFLLPVNAGDTYRVESTGPTVVCTFAPVANSSTETTNVTANSTLTADVDGWVRVSVIDPGTSAGACVRFLVNGVPFANGLPLYKSRIMQNLTGDGDTIRVENGQIKCISTPPASSTANGTAVNSKTSFCFSPDIYYAEPNVTYYTSYKHDIESDDDLAYPEEDLEWQFDSDNFDEGGDIVIALPEVDYPCVVKVCNFDNTHTVVVTQDGKYIVGDDGGAQGWASGQQSDKVGMNQTKVYVFQPTPIHWSSSYSGISAAIEARDGVWWMQTYT